MIVTCTHGCGRTFDDARRSTVCPHDEIGPPIVFTPASEESLCSAASPTVVVDEQGRTGSKLNKIEINLPNGLVHSGEVKIDGVPQTYVCGISFDLDANRDEVPRVSVTYLMPELIVDGEFKIERRVKDPISGKECRLVPVDKQEAPMSNGDNPPIGREIAEEVDRVEKMRLVKLDWQQIPRLLHPVRCGSCLESWFVRVVATGGENDRDFWPRFCCYCGMRYKLATEHAPDGSTRSLGMNGQPIE